MKNIRLIAFLFILVPGTVFCNELKETTASAKVTLPFIELKAAVKDPFNKKNFKYNYGLLLTSKPFTPNFQLILKAGTLSAGGSLSTLNSPELSQTVSAFPGGSLHLKELQVSLPSDTSFSKPQSISLQGTWGSKKLGGSAGIFYDKTSLTNSITINCSPVNKLKLGLNLTGGIYPYKKAGINTWFSTQPFYSQGTHLGAANSFFISYDKNSTLFTVCTYESPFGKYQNTWRLENVFQLKAFTFNLNTFYNQNKMIITSSGKTLDPVFQLECGGQYKHKKITAGINTLADINLNSDSHTSKTALGFKLNGKAFSTSLTSGINLNIKKQTDGINIDFSSGNIKAAFGCAIKDVRPSLSAGFTFEPDKKNSRWNYSEKFGLNVEYASPWSVVISSGNTLTLTQKKQNKIEFTSSLNVRAQFRFCTLRVHLEFQV